MASNSAINTSNPIGVASGGTGLATLTAHSVQVGNGTSAITQLAVGTNGQLLIASTGADPVFATLGAGTGITTSAGAGTLTISAVGGGITWTEVTGTSQSAAINSGYIANNAGLVTVTLPSTAALGSVVTIAGKGAGGWKLAQNSGQTIYFGTSTTTTGATGYLASTAQRDTVHVVCVTQNNDWDVLWAQGNLTVV